MPFCQSCGSEIPENAAVCMHCGVAVGAVAAAPGQQASKAGWIVLIIACAAIIPILGICAAIAIPNFLKFQAKARQSEAKSNLASIAYAELSFNDEKAVWGGSFDLIGWAPVGTERRYSYYLSCYRCASGWTYEAEMSDSWIGTNCEVGISAPGADYMECPYELQEYLSRPCEYSEGCFRAGAVGNVDGDDTLDVWGVDENRDPINLVNDIVN